VILFCVLFLSEFVGDRSTRSFSGDGFVDFSLVVVDHRMKQLVVGVRCDTVHCLKLFTLTQVSANVHKTCRLYDGCITLVRMSCGHTAIKQGKLSYFALLLYTCESYVGTGDCCDETNSH